MEIERTERIEDAILEIAEAVEDGSWNGLSERVGRILFEEHESIEEDE